MIVNKWQYIGDGVYIMFDGYGFMLHANSHSDPTDRIYIEGELVEILVNKLTEEHKEK